MTWHVWSDGSCQHGVPQAPRGVGGWGGWCAIVEHGSDGQVVRGRAPDTTSVRMELQAAIEGLRVIPDGSVAVLHTDCMTILSLYDRWERNDERRLRGRDRRFWRALRREFDRIGSVQIEMIVRGMPDPIHQRCHKIAGAEARGGLRNLPTNSVPVDEDLARARQSRLRRLAVREVPNVTCDLCGSHAGHRLSCIRYRPFAQTSPSQP